MARNLQEAIESVAKETGMTPEFIIDNEIVMEIEAEEGEEFVTWIRDDGHFAKQGEAIGYNIFDGTSEMFYPYEQYRDEEEGM